MSVSITSLLDILPFLLMGVGIWLSLSLLIVGYLLLKNLIEQKAVLLKMTYYLAKQDRQTDAMLHYNQAILGVMRSNLRQINQLQKQVDFHFPIRGREQNVVGLHN